MLQVDYLILADAAAAVEGKHYIHGGGWDTLAAATFPVVHPAMSAAFRLRVPWADTNQAHYMELDVVDADGHSILPAPHGPVRGPITVGRPAQAIPGADQVVPLVFSLLMIRFERPGAYVAVLRINGSDLARAPFHVVARPFTSQRDVPAMGEGKL